MHDIPNTRKKCAVCIAAVRLNFLIVVEKKGGEKKKEKMINRM